MKNEISAKELKELRRAKLKLDCLEAGGVDNWEFYGDALDEYSKTIKAEDEAEAVFDEILTTLSSGAYEPSEREAGLAFSEVSEDAAFEIFRKFVFDRPRTERRPGDE